MPAKNYPLGLEALSLRFHRLDPLTGVLADSKDLTLKIARCGAADEANLRLTARQRNNW